eukprot:4567284-Prymnesium_polylepis.2
MSGVRRAHGHVPARASDPEREGGTPRGARQKKPRSEPACVIRRSWLQWFWAREPLAAHQALGWFNTGVEPPALATPAFAASSSPLTRRYAMARSNAKKSSFYDILRILAFKIKLCANAAQVCHIRHTKCAFNCPLFHSHDLVVLPLRKILLRVAGPAELVV